MIIASEEEKLSQEEIFEKNYPQIKEESEKEKKSNSKNLKKIIMIMKKSIIF